jgi:hypothetical protein
MDQLGVKEALFARLRLTGLGLESIDALLIERLVVEAGGADRGRGHARRTRTTNGILNRMRNLRCSQLVGPCGNPHYPRP